MYDDDLMLIPLFRIVRLSVRVLLEPKLQVSLHENPEPVVSESWKSFISVAKAKREKELMFHEINKP